MVVHHGGAARGAARRAKGQAYADSCGSRILSGYEGDVSGRATPQEDLFGGLVTQELAHEFHVRFEADFRRLGWS